MKQFTTKEREVQIIEFELDGRVIQFRPPKRAGLITSVVNSVALDARAMDTDSTRDLLNWLGEGMVDDADAEWILGRLQDPDDDFDIMDVNEIAKYLLSQDSNRPTRRRRG